jgi:thioesterase domain-containing protein
MMRFLKNLPYWLYDFLQLKPNEMWARILRKIRLAVQEIGRKYKPIGPEPTRADLESIIDDDLDQIPETYHKFLRAHYQALINYTPQPYAGSIALFRTRKYSLLGPFDPQMGWSKLAVGGVEVHEIRGFHANILQSPYVQRLVEQLRARLDESLIIFQ